MKVNTERSDKVTNRKWLGSMCLADMLNLLIQNNSKCVISMFGKRTEAGRCNWFMTELEDRGEPLNMHKVCYNCACHWLNEKNISKPS